MRLGSMMIACCVAAMLTLAGCKSTPYVRPPKPPEELRDPPLEDARFSQPPSYPKNVLNIDRITKPDSTDPANPATGMPRGGAARPGGPGGF